MSEEAVVHAGHFGLAVVGHALARHWLTDPEKVRARTEELRTILDGLDASVEPYSWELRVRELDVEAGYELIPAAARGSWRTLPATRTSSAR